MYEFYELHTTELERGQVSAKQNGGGNRQRAYTDYASGGHNSRGRPDPDGRELAMCTCWSVVRSDVQVSGRKSTYVHLVIQLECTQSLRPN